MSYLIKDDDIHLTIKALREYETRQTVSLANCTDEMKCRDLVQDVLSARTVIVNIMRQLEVSIEQLEKTIRGDNGLQAQKSRTDSPSRQLP